MVEHDPEIMRAADRILDLGPGAGENGGKVVGAGTYNEIIKMPHSLTGRYLADELHIQIPAKRRTPGSHKLRITGARAHNLKHIDLEIPLDMLVAITGVSGSGKSSLLHDVLYQALATAKRQTNGSGAGTVLWDSVEGDEFLDEVVLVDRSPDRPHTALESSHLHQGLRHHTELFASLPRRRSVDSRRPLFLQCPRRPLRDLPGGRHGHGRDAVSGRRRADVRRMQRPPLQDPGSRNALQGQEHLRSFESDDSRGA